MDPAPTGEHGMGANTVVQPSLIAGRVVPRESVTWSNHEFAGKGLTPITPALNIPRVEIECLYVNGEEVAPTPEQIIAMQTAVLEDRAAKLIVRREKAATKKAAKDTFDRVGQRPQIPFSAPSIAPSKNNDDGNRVQAHAKSRKTNNKTGGSSEQDEVKAEKDTN